MRLEHVNKADFLVEEQIVVELKAVSELLPVHFAQLQSYLALSRAPLGFLENFHVPLFKQGVHRRIGPLA